MPFQTTVNTQQAPAVAGDFANKNPRATVTGQQGQIIAGPGGVTIGRFAWLDATGTYASNTGQGIPAGFVSRDQQGTITTWLADNGFVIPSGYPVVLFDDADFFVVNAGTAATAYSQKAYANNANGTVSFAATGTPPSSGTCTSGTLQKIVSNATNGAIPTANTCTASISGLVMTVSAVTAGSVLGAGQTISGGTTGTGIITPNTTIVNQLTGTAGSTGTYTVSISQNIASTTVTMSGGGLTLTGANTSGIFAPGMTISGTNVPAGCTILGYGTATAGGAGTYYVSILPGTAVTAATITAANAMFLTVDASSTGVWALNDPLYGTGVVNQAIAATNAQNPNLTGTGGAGTYLTSAYQASALTAQTISAYTSTETKWVAQSVAAVGELAVMTSHILG